MTRKKLYTIGLLATELSDFNDRELLLGLTDFSLQRGFRLVYFDGGRLRDPQGFNAQGNILYEFIGKENVDALIIWSSALGCFVTNEEIQAFCDHYHPLPIVGIGAPLTGFPSVLVDSYQGMFEAVSHLVAVHDCKRIVFIRGPKSHYDSEERYRAYRDVLEKYGLDFDPELVSAYGNWTTEHGQETIRIMLDKRRTSFNAIVGVSSRFATGAVIELQRRGIRIPGQVAVAGFDDRPSCRAMEPPMTVVPIMLYERGRIAAELVFKILKGEEVPARTLVPCHPIIRRSCGCKPLTERAVTVVSALKTKNGGKSCIEQFLIESRNDILKALEQAASPNQQMEPGWEERLLECFARDLKEDAPGAFVSELERIISNQDQAALNLFKWHNVLTAFQPKGEGMLGYQQLLACANILSQAAAFLHEIEIREELNKWLRIDEYTQTLISIGHSVTTVFNIEELADIIASELPKLSIPSCYLCLYDNPQKSFAESRLIMAYDRNKRFPLDLAKGGLKFPSAQLLPQGIFSNDHAMTQLIEPLYYQEHQLGYVVFEVGPREASVYAMLRTQLSSVIWGALIFEKQKKTEASLARQARELARSNAELEQFAYVVSHDLQEPLRKISVFGERLQKPSDPQSAEYLERMIHASIRMQGLIKDLLAYSRVSSGPKEFLTVNLDAVAQEVLADLEVPIRKADALIEISPLPTIEAEALQMRQLFQNLIANALKFRKANVRPVIRVYAAMTKDHMHEIIFEDNGIGIDPAYHEKIFGVFERLHSRDEYDGSGIGLAICKKILDRHRGHITVDGQAGIRTVFHVYLPAIR